MVTDVLVQGSESRLKCQDVVLDCFSHFCARWKRSVGGGCRLRHVIGVAH
jgi:hypothetical protein